MAAKSGVSGPSNKQVSSDGEGASSNSLKSSIEHQKNGDSAGAKAAKTILINKLSKYINIKNNQKKNQGLNNSKRKVSYQTPSQNAKDEKENQQEILESLRHFLNYLEGKKIINITEVV